KLPILGALGRSSIGSKEKTELIVMITPHIIKDESTVARSNAGVPTSQIASSGRVKPDNNGEDGFVPVSWSSQSNSSALPPLQPVNVIENGELPAVPD